MYVVIEKINSMYGNGTDIFGTFSTKEHARDWISIRKEELKNNNSYLPRTWSVRKLRDVE